MKKETYFICSVQFGRLSTTELDLTFIHLAFFNFNFYLLGCESQRIRLLKVWRYLNKWLEADRHQAYGDI